MTTIDQKIKNKFGLFRGLREKKEDELIFEKVCGLVIEEISNFLQENMDSKLFESLISELEKVDDLETKMEVLRLKTAGIDDLAERLDGRIDYFLDNLVYNLTYDK